MRRAPSILLALGMMLPSATLLADDSANVPQQFSRRQLADCMTKRMYASRTLSYNDAAKACKDQLRGRKPDAALNNAPKPLS